MLIKTRLFLVKSIHNSEFLFDIPAKETRLLIKARILIIKNIDHIVCCFEIQCTSYTIQSFSRKHLQSNTISWKIKSEWMGIRIERNIDILNTCCILRALLIEFCFKFHTYLLICMLSFSQRWFQLWFDAKPLHKQMMTNSHMSLLVFSEFH